MWYERYKHIHMPKLQIYMICIKLSYAQDDFVYVWFRPILYGFML